MPEEYNYPSLELIEKPALEPLTLAEIKTFLRIDGNSEDNILTTMLAAAREAGEHYMRNSIIRQKYKLTYHKFMPARIALPKGPVSMVSKVTLKDEDGSFTILSSSDYYISNKTNLNLKSSYSSYIIEVEYFAGYSNDSVDVPEIIKQGLLSQIAFTYENRGTAKTGLDPSAESLFGFFRNYYI